MRYGDIKRSYAAIRLNIINYRHTLQYYWFRNQGKIELFSWLVTVSLLILATKLTQPIIHSYLRNDKFVDTLGATALQLGSSLLGATAIVASLVLFAMQINVERLPHGLFRRLSTDKKLLISFAFSFVASILIACLPLITPIKFTAWAISAAVLLTLVVLRLFLATYRRALELINPVEQLRIIMGDVTVALNTWSNQADWSIAALTPREQDKAPDLVINSNLDMQRATFMIQNGWGGDFAIRGLGHCISMNSRTVSQGDYEVADAALNALVKINEVYVKTKGRTFFAQNGLFDVPFSDDRVINYCLEQLKIQFRFAVGRRDEEHVNLLLKAYGRLIALYAQIDYDRPGANAWHADLAIGYLKSDIRSIIPQNLPDNLMQGVRVLGRSAITLLNRGAATEIVGIVNELGALGGATVIREDYRPVAITAVEQLTNITYHMIKNGCRDPGYAFEQIETSLKMIATVAVDQPSSGFQSVPSIILAPYMSHEETSFASRLGEIANVLQGCPADDEKAKKCIGNLHEWADHSQGVAKDILLLAIKKRSKFTYDSLHWISNVVEVLLAAASVPASNGHFESELGKLASSWAFALSWIPNDANSIDCASSHSATSSIFEIAANARKWNSEDVYDVAQQLSLRWALKSERRANAWHDMEEAILSSLSIAINSYDDPNGEAFITRFKLALTEEHLPPPELLDKTAQCLIRRIDVYDQNYVPGRGWDAILKALDAQTRRKLLTDVANLLQEAAQRH